MSLSILSALVDSYCKLTFSIPIKILLINIEIVQLVNSKELRGKGTTLVTVYCSWKTTRALSDTVSLVGPKLGLACLRLSIN